MEDYHSALTDHVPGFITEPGQTDYLFVGVIVFLIVMILVVGNLYFQLHAIPERIAHRTNKVQMEIVAVLALISLFTHNHLYWILGLLLAFVRFPDFTTPLYSIARSLARLAGRDPDELEDEAPVAADHPEPVRAPTPAPESVAEAPPARTPAKTLHEEGI
ncbi:MULTISPECIES: hypothetical protein [unclassified Rhizobium]|uniref:hypothetical protein n=1 Tax=unclassified Rhizobium TaxID=2613769 RepID=UPI001C834D5D|nr:MULTISPECIES: hypothetical protein [unclassified Rhizobium]MBX5214473.1 hypothetical protein [Rhizobium sp. NLR9a]MBX5227569.1 hypothetical protein [Rhizobium sp. NLR9b]MBX5245685.1 hypothetical protein [Rhizobium sp. NLR3b]MBX5273602.1 hypothetical protein [Rhizobium sp. NLR13a]MBX5279848.1 hypothetical protein [Rhizobium sp. NLR10a]